MEDQKPRVILPEDVVDVVGLLGGGVDVGFGAGDEVDDVFACCEQADEAWQGEHDGVADVGGDVGRLMGAFLVVAEDLLEGGVRVLDDLGVGVGGPVGVQGRQVAVIVFLGDISCRGEGILLIAPAIADNGLNEGFISSGIGGVIAPIRRAAFFKVAE